MVVVLGQISRYGRSHCTATWQTGSNTVKVNVTAANGTAKKTYTVTVTKS